MGIDPLEQQSRRDPRVTCPDAPVVMNVANDCRRVNVCRRITVSVANGWEEGRAEPM